LLGDDLMLKLGAKPLHRVLVSADIAISAAVFLLLISYPGLTRAIAPGVEGGIGISLLAIVAALVWPVTLSRFGLYESQRRKSLWAVPARMVSAAAIPVAALAATAFVVTAPVIPLFPIVCGLAQLAALTSVRLVGFSWLRWARRRGKNFRSVVIVGTGKRAAAVHSQIERHPEWGLRILCLTDEGDVPVDSRLRGETIHKFVDFPSLVRDEVIDELIVACPRSMLSSIEPLVRVCATAGLPVLLLADIFGDFLPAPRVGEFDSVPALSFAPVHHNALSLAIKRGVDVVIGSLALVAFAPVIGVAAALIRFTSPGPAFYRQVRCGLNGRPFMMLKLRTMVDNADEQKEDLLHLNEMDGPVVKMLADPRVTPIGRNFRRWSVDELPQLWNVVRGDMSLVGPRPAVPSEVDRYSVAERRRLSMRPGITCIWQVKGRNTIAFDEWVKLDVEYIDTWSLPLDLRLLGKTIPAVLSGTGAR
jgi:exopolysaccharide biosynthesis polyprenyl glycosylphosphotransferase